MLRISHRAKPQHLPFSDPSAAVRRFDTVIRILGCIVRNPRHFLAMRDPIASELVGYQSVFSQPGEPATTQFVAVGDFHLSTLMEVFIRIDADKYCAFGWIELSINLSG